MIVVGGGAVGVFSVMLLCGAKTNKVFFHPKSRTKIRLLQDFTEKQNGKNVAVSDPADDTTKTT